MSDLYLVHHGIKGQIWGKKNGPPYPLDYKSHSAKEKSNNPKSKIDGKDEHKSKKGLTDKQKQIIKTGATIAATVAVSYAGYKFATSPAVRGYVSKALGKIGETPVSEIDDYGAIYSNILGRNLTNTEIQLFENKGAKPQVLSIFNKMDKAENLAEAAKHSNPNPFNGISNFEKMMNCGNSVMANELRMRGYDVVAKNNTNGLTISSMGEFLNNLDSKSFIQPNMSNLNTKGALDLLPNKVADKSRMVIKEIKNSIINSIDDKYARGCMFVPTSKGSHWVSWEKIGSVVEFSNPQDPRINLDKQFFGYFTYFKDKDVSVTAIRLDNLEINEKSIGQLVTDRLKPDYTETFNTWMTKGTNFVMKRT